MKLSPDRVTLLDFILAVRKVKFDHPNVDGMSVSPITRQLMARPLKPFNSLPQHIQTAIENAEGSIAGQAEEAVFAFHYFTRDFYQPPEEVLAHLLRSYSAAQQRLLTLEELRLLIDKLKLHDFGPKVFSRV